MLNSHLGRRAVRLLGAVAVTGVLSAGVLATAPAAAQSVRPSSGYATSHSHLGHSTDKGTLPQANGLNVLLANGLGAGRKGPNYANGLRHTQHANGL